MTDLPNPFTDSGVSPSTPDDAASLPHSHAPGEAAEIDEPSTSTGGHQGAPASTSTVTVAAGDAGATDDSRFVLDEALFLTDIEPPPLFLQQRTG